MDEKKAKPDCYKCVHRLEIPGDCHSRCNNHTAKVVGSPHGIKHGLFMWPLKFDPVFLEFCDGFSNDPKDRKPTRKLDPLAELFSLLR